MERKIMYDFRRWRQDNNHKPLLVYGAKQVGKTYSVLEFGEKEFKTTAYIDCDNNLELQDILRREKNIDKILVKLSVLVGEPILKQDTLIVFDNVNDQELVSMIKRLGKEAPEYYVILITSLKENVLKFKGEELQYKYMTGLDFEEYLKAINQSQLIDFIKASCKNNKPMPFHNLAMDYYDNYIMSGGLPEAVKQSIENPNTLYLNLVHGKILDSYQKELLHLTNLIDITRAKEAFDISPYQLMKPNRKFQYGLMRSGSRSKEYENAIEFLSSNSFVNRAYKVSAISVPLSKNKEKDSFKLYASDTGLLFHMMHLNKIKYLSDDRLRYILYENSIANSIVGCGYSLYYYQSEGKAEVPFIVQTRTGKTLPIELVNKNVSKSKALTLVMNKFNLTEAIRFTEENFHTKKGIKYIPFYASFCLKDLL